MSFAYRNTYTDFIETLPHTVELDGLVVSTPLYTSDHSNGGLRK